MANTFLTPSVVAREATLVLKNECVAAGLIRNPSHQAEFTGAEKVGDSISIRVPGAANVRNFTGTATSRDVTEGSKTLTVEKHWYDQVAVSQKEWTLELGQFTEQVIRPIVKGFAEALSTYACSKIQLIPYWTGTAGDPPDTIAEIAAIHKVLDGNKVPQGGRIALVDHIAKADLWAIEAFHSAEKRGDEGSALRSASLGDIAGFNWYMDQSISGSNAHTAGTFQAGAPLVNGAVLAAATTVDIDGGSGTETILAGDLFTVAGVTGQFVFTANKTASGGAITGATFYPAAPTGGFADNAAITIIGSHTKNVTFAPGAFTLVAFPPLPPQGARGDTFFDQELGLGLSVVYDYSSSALGDLISFQLLAGAALQQPELACVVLG